MQASDACIAALTAAGVELPAKLIVGGTARQMTIVPSGDAALKLTLAPAQGATAPLAVRYLAAVASFRSLQDGVTSEALRSAWVDGTGLKLVVDPQVAPTVEALWGEASSAVRMASVTAEALADGDAIGLVEFIAGKRAPDEQDRSDYQTMFAASEGAVAAPTAGLHFTPDLEAALRARGIGLHRLTLHVGAGTFLPVKADDTSGHRMHAEWGAISEETAAALNAARARGGRIAAVGTTSLRLLESAARGDGTVAPFADETAIFITPGYRFKAVDVLMTNFHLPRSTLFMLVSAFAGLDTMQAAYAHAVANNYRFYSYGDASLLFRAGRVQ